MFYNSDSNVDYIIHHNSELYYYYITYHYLIIRDKIVNHEILCDHYIEGGDLELQKEGKIPCNICKKNYFTYKINNVLENLKYHKDKIQEISINVFNKNNIYNYLFIENNLKYFPILESVSIRYFNNKNYDYNNDFIIMNNNIKKLKLIRSNIHLENLININNLKILKLYDCDLENKLNFDIFNNLEELEINNSSIKNNDEYILNKLDKLKFLEISYLKDDELKLNLNFINNNLLLERLYLIKIKLITLPNLDNLVNLKKLNISDNNLTILPNLNNLKNLMELDISYNNLTNLPNLNNLINLYELDISSNKLSNLSNLDNLKELYYLNISNNKLSYLPNLNKLKELHHLNISNNKLSNLPNLNNLTNLKYFNISKNNITIFPNYTKLLSLTDLDCSFNPLLSINNIQFRDLTILDIENTKIQNLPLNWRLKKLEKIYIKNAPIKNIPRYIIDSDIDIIDSNIDIID